MGSLGISEFYLLYWGVIGGLVGLAIGQTRGRPLPGFFLGLLIGPIGWLLVLVGPNPKKAKEDKEKQDLLQQQFALQQAQLEELKRLQNPPRASSPTLPPPGARETIHIAKNGEDLGPVTVAEVKRMLADGRLTIEDYYFDVCCNEWLELAGHPTLSEI
jgi:hypothetical protein